jgi:hypothetical protein
MSISALLRHCLELVALRSEMRRTLFRTHGPANFEWKTKNDLRILKGEVKAMSRMIHDFTTDSEMRGVMNSLFDTLSVEEIRIHLKTFNDERAYLLLAAINDN